jgi:hypothetical protein
MIAKMKNLIVKILPFRLRRFLRGSKINKVELARREKILFDLIDNIDEEQYKSFRDEISFLKEKKNITAIPYPKTGLRFGAVEARLDEERKMPYVVHNGKRLYFRRRTTVEAARKAYVRYITIENILGGGYLKKTPHQYVTNQFSVKNGDTLIDVGGAEGLFLLDNIDKIRKGYIIEAKAEWREALEATFEPYKEKVEIIMKYATNKVSETEAAIDDLLKDDLSDSFIKIDVEGYERLVLDGCKDTLKSDKDIRVACCTYHRSGDAETLKTFFKETGYHTEFSDGYMLFLGDKKIEPPYFRKGLIRAWNRG